MGAKGRKRKQREKAKHRTGLLKSLSGPNSLNQITKRRLMREDNEATLSKLEKLMFG